jgi:hypothetical protein
MVLNIKYILRVLKPIYEESDLFLVQNIEAVKVCS